MLARADAADVVVMAAAVADFRPGAGRPTDKIKKADGVPDVVLEPTPDILAELGRRRAARPDPRRLRRRDRRRAPANAADKLAPQGRRPHRGQRRLGPGRGLRARHQRVVILGADGVDAPTCRSPTSERAERCSTPSWPAVRPHRSSTTHQRGATRDRRWTFTSESVTEGHPDKMADQISDSVLDAILAEDPMARVACETLVTTGLVVVAGEITTTAYVEIPKLVRETINGIGYDNAQRRLRRQHLRRDHLDRPAVARHRPGRRHRLRDPHRRRPARTSSTPRAPATRG